MKKYILYFLFTFLAISANGQTPLWENLYPSTSWFIAITQLYDSTIVVTGGKEQQPVFPARLVRLNLNGNNIWQKNGIAAYTGEQDIKQAANGKLIYATSKWLPIPPSNFSDQYVQQIDAATGDTSTTWSVQYATDHITEFTSEMVLMENGDVVTAGMAMDETPAPSPDRYFNFFTLRRTDSLGNEIWYRRFARGHNTYGTRLIKNLDGNFVLIGVVRRPYNNTTPMHPFIIEVSPSGDSIRGARLLIKNESILEEVGRLYNNIIQTKDGNYVFSGRFNTGLSTAFIAKVDQQFNLLWYYEHNENTQPAGYSATKVAELPDSTLVFLGRDFPLEPGGFEIIRISKDGQFISKQTLVSSTCPNGFMIPDNWLFLPDSSIVICGRCEGVTPRQGYIGRWGNLNLGPVLAASEGLQPAKSAVLGKAYPNPASKQVKISYKLPEQVSEAEIRLIEPVTGRLLMVVMLPVKEGEAETTVSLSSFASGLYTYTLIVDGQPVSTKKLAVIR